MLPTPEEFEEWLAHDKNVGVVQLIADNPAVCPPMVFAGQELDDIEIEGLAVGWYEETEKCIEEEALWEGENCRDTPGKTICGIGRPNSSVW